MNNSDDSRNSYNNNNVHMGVNKIGKKITKNHPGFDIQSSSSRPQFQPRVYNINKNDFRNIVQQLTGSPAHQYSELHPLLPAPPANKSPATTTLQRIRPPPLSPVNVSRPRMMVQTPPQDGLMGLFPSHDHHRILAKPVESPVSSYMRYLQRSVSDSSHPSSSGLLPNPPSGLHPSPRTNGPGPGPAPLLPSPSGYLNLLSPRSPHVPLLSPGYQLLQPLTPNYPFSPAGQPGNLGPGPQDPVSHGIGFLLSPGVFPLSSPRRRD